MRRLTMVFLSVVIAVVSANPIFCESQTDSSQQTPTAAPAFVEAAVPDGKVLVYFYRPSLFSTAVGVPDLLLLAKDGPLVILPVLGYYAYFADPGTLKFWITSVTAAGIKMEAAAGKIYYVKADILTVPFVGVTASLTLVPRGEAMKEITRCKQLYE